MNKSEKKLNKSPYDQPSSDEEFKNEHISPEKRISQDIIYKYASPPNPLPPKTITIHHEPLKLGMPNLTLLYLH